METVVGVEGNGDGKFEEAGVEKTSSMFTTISSPKQTADPVVYKLVRVEGDGRFVPATDEEVMEVVDLLENDKRTMHIVADSGKTVRCISNEGSSSGKSLLESSEGVSENTEVDAGRLNARLQYIEDMLQKVKQEERLRLAFGSPDHYSAYMHVDSQCSDRHDRLHVIDEKPQSIITLQEPVECESSLSPNINYSSVQRSGSLGDCCSSPPREPVECESSPSSDYPSQKPDFSKLEGEICLDNLTIRELQETFKAAFGRETTVKDKMWLKRRIAMGLTNSCDVSATTFIIKDNKLVVKGEKKSCKSINHDCIMIPVNQVSPADCSGQMEDHETVSAKRLRNYNEEYACGGEDVQNEHTIRKRVRKPTKRYIEELSESDSLEHDGRLLATSRCSLLEQISPRSFVRPVRNVSSDGRAVITRLDSLGGSGVQIPYVSRIRRSRPRKNVMALMQFHPSSPSMAAEVVKKAVGVQSSESCIENEKSVMKSGYATEPIMQQVVADPGNKQQSVPSKIETGQNVEPKHSDSSGETSDDNIATVPTAKGGMRRKHHRAWTISEVMKLVEGVSKYGAGRWSEIKRLAFASYSYRTSVDLKDKWRNLLKASFAQTPPDQGINSRKHVSTPIPAPVLLRVRQLAEMHA